MTKVHHISADLQHYFYFTAKKTRVPLPYPGALKLN